MYRNKGGVSVPTFKRNKRKVLVALLSLFVSLVIIGWYWIELLPTYNLLRLGGFLQSSQTEIFNIDYKAVSNISNKDNLVEWRERFLRPSKQILPPETFGLKADGKGYRYTKEFKESEKLARAYFEILADASNLIKGKTGGCGSVGMGDLPYRYAYNYLSKNYKNKVSLLAFKKSFQGIGRINLLKLYPAWSYKWDEKNAHYFYEIETIEGTDERNKTVFAYYHGLISLTTEGPIWRVNDISVSPQDFLCHSNHGWWYEGETIIELLWQKEKDFVDHIYRKEEGKNGLIEIYVLGKGGRKIKFQFIRLTNGADKEINRYVWQENQWIPVSLEEF